MAVMQARNAGVTRTRKFADFVRNKLAMIKSLFDEHFSACIAGLAVRTKNFVFVPLQRRAASRKVEGVMSSNLLIICRVLY